MKEGKRGRGLFFSNPIKRENLICKSFYFAFQTGFHKVESVGHFKENFNKGSKRLALFNVALELFFWLLLFPQRAKAKKAKFYDPC